MITLINLMKNVFKIGLYVRMVYLSNFGWFYVDS
jgi:hypothetical protein